MELRHYPRNNGEFYLAPMTYGQAVNHKPHGFWVSVKGPTDWASWCVDNEFCADSIEREYRVELVPEANVLVLDSVASLLDFTQTFSTPWEWESDRATALDLPRPINWPAVAQAWGGIVIAPYQWSLRMDLHWYYGWDCASGCIWDLSQIQSVTSMELSSDSL